MKQYIDETKFNDTIMELLKGCIDNPEQHESRIEEYAWEVTEGAMRSFRKLAHTKDHHMDGNFANLRDDWEHNWIARDTDVEPWGTYDELVRTMEDGSISDEQLERVQEWMQAWYFGAFGTWGICYNFQTLISEIEYRDEREAA